MAVTDNFSGTLANWTKADSTGTNWSIVSNQLQNDGAGTAMGLRWTANAWNANQTSKATRVANTNAYWAACVRLSGTSTATLNGYFFFSNAAGLQKVVNGANSSLAGWGSAVAGDVVELDITGTTLEGFINGVSQGTFPDSTFASGDAGLGAYGSGGGVNLIYDDWQGTGEISTAGDTQEWRGCVEDVGVRRRNPISAMYRTIVDWLRPAWWRTTWQMC